MAIKKINLIVEDNFTCAGKPEVIYAKKGVQAISILGNEFILYVQEKFPSGNTWVAKEQVVIPVTESGETFNPSLMLMGG